METTKKSLLIFLGLLIVGGSAYGTFYLLKKYISRTENEPLVTMDQPASSTPVISGFEQNLHNEVPSVLPKDVLFEKNVTVVESFTVKNAPGTQYTYRYISKLSFGENYSYFFKTLRNAGWETKTVTRTDNDWFMFFAKPKQELNISYSFNKETKVGIIDITFLQKNNE